MTHLLTMYFLDSGSYSSGAWDWFGFFHPTSYDYLRQSQIDWFLQESCTSFPAVGVFPGRPLTRVVASIDAIERPFTPDGAKDLGDIWERQAGQVLPGSKRLAKPNALMFFHIPLCVRLSYIFLIST